MVVSKWKSMVVTVAVIAVLGLLAGCVVPLPMPVAIQAPIAPAPAEGPGAPPAPGIGAHGTAGPATPEEAVAAYVAALAQADFGLLMESTAVEWMAEETDFIATAERMRAITPQSLAPNTDPFLVATNRAILASRVAFQARNVLYALLAGLSDDALSRTIVLEEGSNEPQAFIATLETERLRDLRLLATADPTSSMGDAERVRINAARTAAALGADDWLERVALVSFEGVEYLLGFQLVRYGDRWFVASQTSAFAGTSAMGVPAPMSAAEFRAAFPQ